MAHRLCQCVRCCSPYRRVSGAILLHSLTTLSHLTCCLYDSDMYDRCQVFAQPLYASFEGWLVGIFMSGEGKEVPSLLRLCFRTVYVGFTTGVAIAFPYFNQVVGVAGSVVFWPVVVYFPVEMYLVQKNIGSRTIKSIVLRLYCSLIFFVMAFAFLGSVQGLIAAKLSL